MRLRPILGWATALFLLGSGWATPAYAQISGRVLSTGSDEPLTQAMVSLIDSAGVVIRTTPVDFEGSFFLLSPPPERGPVMIYAEAFGFLSMMEGPLPPEWEGTLQVEMRLEPQPVELDSLDVEVRPRSTKLDLNGYYMREAMGQGFHMDRLDITDNISAVTTADLLRAIPGVTVNNTGEVELRGVANFATFCFYRVYLDGVLMVSPVSWDPNWPTNLIRPQELEGIEVYRRPAEVPPQYAQSGACGVILLWSRGGGRRGNE